ncbi:MAG: DUF1329 domain-containing protein [Proteobacteria bacterium]|nr:DUF1329 domain-containing protein [Pseudomonadota bacterium]
MRLQKTKKISTTLILLSFFIAGITVVVPHLVYAEEVAGFGPCFTDQELAKVREWEKTWVGKKIDKTNVDQVAEFLPEHYVNGVYKANEKWNEKESYYFYIVPYQRYIDTPGLQEATKKYSASIKTNAQGEIVNYAEGGGRPFPDPKTGTEMMYNFDYNTHGDASTFMRHGPVVETKARRERISDQPMNELFYIHRTDVDPKPALPNNSKGVLKAMQLELLAPPEMLGTKMFNLRFIDIKKSDDGYLWYSQFRRIRRIQTTQRSDTIAGTDLVYDDEYHYDNHIEMTNWKFIGKKDMLCARHMKWDDAVRVEGQPIPNNVKRERCNVLVVEGFHKDPDYIYKRKVLYLDPESFISYWCDMYDHYGKFWKGYENWTLVYKEEATGWDKMYNTGGIWTDFQRTHAGSAYQKNVKVGVKEIDQNLFTIANLQKSSYGSH